MREYRTGRPSTIGKVFVDSNVLIYAYDRDAAAKERRAADRLTLLWDSHAGCLSTQVLQEFYVNVTRKIGIPLRADAAREVVRIYAPWVQSPTTPETIIRASEIAEIWQVSFRDSVILADAEQCGASQLLTEDLNHGQTIAGIAIVNPFL